MRNKIKKILSMLLIGIMFGAIPAVAVDVYWLGNGKESVTTCSSGQAPYLHWILTGVDKTEPYILNLIIENNNIQVTEKIGERSGSSGTYHFYSGFFDPTTITSAYVLEVPGGNNLVISGGCTGSQIPEFPTVALPIAAVIGLVFFFQQRKVKGS